VGIIAGLGAKLRECRDSKRRIMDYSELPQFAKYDVGEGFLLDVKEGDSLELTVEAALTYAHPEAIPGTISWKKILIVFPRVRSFRWITRKMHPTVDPDGSIDYGSIDCFIVERDKSRISGRWGEIEIVSDPVLVSEIA